MGQHDTAARYVPIPLLKKVEKEIKRMKDGGVIEEITEATEWVSPMVSVVKPSGNIRICVDLKKLNEAVKRERYIIPTVDDVIHQLRGSSVFLKLDAASGVSQIPPQPDNRNVSHAHNTIWTILLQAIFLLEYHLQCSEIFQRTMTKILTEIDGVLCYLDDILCHTSTTEEHEQLFIRVKKTPSEVGFQLNKKKGEYLKSEINFLGHIISGNGVRPDLSKVDAVAKMAEPANFTELRRYLGMVNYLAGICLTC